MDCESEPSASPEIFDNNLALKRTLLILYRVGVLGFGLYNIGRYLRDRKDTNSIVCIVGLAQVTSAIAGPYMLNLLWERIHDTKFGISLYDFFVLRTLKGIRLDIES